MKNNASGFARTWDLTLIFGIGVYVTSRAIEEIASPLTARIFGLPTASTLDRIMISYGLNSVFLILMFFIHRRTTSLEIKFAGDIKTNTIPTGMACITAIYIADYFARKLLNQPREPSIDSLLKINSTCELMALVLTLLILPPIVEELTFRHFLISLFPYRSNRYVAALAAFVTSAYFSFCHSYQNTETYILIFIIGIVLSIYRILTNGILTSMFLHSYAICMSILVYKFL